MINYKMRVNLLVSILLSFTFIGCDNGDNVAEEIPIPDYTSALSNKTLNVISNRVVFRDMQDGYMSIDGGGKIFLSSAMTCCFDSLSYGWHTIKFFSNEGETLNTLYYNKIDSGPDILVSDSIVSEGRRLNKRYWNKRYKEYLQDSYQVKDTYFGWYHTISSGSVDTNGIPVFIKDRIEYYHPVNIAQYALSFWNVGDKMTSEDKEIFLKCADFIGSEVAKSGGGPYGFDFVMHGILYKAPWYSGMAQGQMLSVMARAYMLTKDEKYRRYGDKILSFMVADAGENYPYAGCKVTLGQFSAIHKELSKYKDLVIYDEYVDKQCTYVLNGNLFGLVGLHDYFEATGDEKASLFFDEGCKSIAIMLPYYDYYGATSYDLLHLMIPGAEPVFGNSYAHDYHIVILDALYTYTRNEIFAKYRDIFESYYEPPFRN